MSSNSQDQEIDLGQVFSKIGSLFQSGIDSLFDVFLFIRKNFLILAILLVSGIVLGTFLDKNNKSYTHEIIVTPNFNSIDFLYSKMDLLNSKIKERDTVFLKKIGIIEFHNNVKEIKIEPIIDVYSIIQNNESNFALIKLMKEDGDLDKILEGDLTRRTYSFHTVKFSTKKQTTSQETIKPILAFLNNSDYYSTIQKEYVNNIMLKTTANDSTIAQINKLLNNFTKTTSISQKSDKLVYYNENNQLNELIKTKDALISEQGVLRINLINNNTIIKEISTTINIRQTEGINGKMKLIAPFLLISLFFVFSVLLAFYKCQVKKRIVA